jgi:phosphate transport system substrate-binding protein
MSSKAISADDRQAFPSTNFTSAQIGADAVGIIVRREVFDGGVRNLDHDQLQALFEGRIHNWKELGGPNIDVFVYDKEPGRGTREVLDKFLYGPNGKAPPPPQSGFYAVVGANEEGRAKVLSTPGGVTPLSTAFLAGYPGLAAVSVSGIEPTSAHIADGTYPLSRPLFLVTNGPPQGPAKTVIDFVLGPDGQALVHKSGYLTLADLHPAR